MGKLVLTVEEPFQTPRYYEWNADTWRKFRLDQADIETLVEGKIVWIGDDHEIALTLESEE